MNERIRPIGYIVNAEPKQLKIEVEESTPRSSYFSEELLIPNDINREGLEELLMSGFGMYIPEGDIEEVALEFFYFMRDARLFVNSTHINSINIISFSKRATQIKEREEKLENTPHIENNYEDVYSYHPLEYWSFMEDVCRAAIIVGAEILAERAENQQ